MQNPARWRGPSERLCELRLGSGRVHWLVDDLIKLTQLGLAFEGNLQGRAPIRSQALRARSLTASISGRFIVCISFFPLTLWGSR